MKPLRSCTPILLCLAAAVIYSCDRSPEVEAEPLRAQAELPEIAPISGVQDLWPFEFGFDASRSEAARILGPPVRVENRDVGRSDASVVAAYYPDLELVFLRRESDVSEYLLSARFTGPRRPLGMDIHVGMELESLRAALGEPGHETGDRIVYFYYTTSIEVVFDGPTVTEIVLARALP